MLKRLSIKGRMYLIICSILALFLIMIWFAYSSAQKVKKAAIDDTAGIMHEAQKEKIMVATHALAKTLSNALAGIDDQEKQVEIIRKQLSGIVFEEDKSGYFFVNRGTTNISHINPDLHGKDMKGAVDPNGVKLIVELDRQASDGGGFVSYMWDKKGVGQAPKISYAQMIPGTEYWIGTGVYIDNIDTQTAAMAKDIDAGVKSMIRNMILVSGVIFAVIVALCLVIVFGIGRSLNSMIDSFRDIAQGEGDLTKRIAIDSNDELGKLGTYYNRFLEKLVNIIQQLAKSARQIDHSSSDLVDIATQMAQGSADTSDRAGKVAEAAQDMSSNLTAVAAAMEESSTNAGMVASAAEEMNATINEIAQNAEKARDISNSAATKTSEAEKTMTALTEAARSIGKVTDTIAEISDQTNLLALNATIEAARAGEAGKGFAVVANEIKELANQTVAATGHIREQIDSVQANTDTTVTAIKEVSGVISDVNDIVSTIAAAVTEQSTVTKEIADNISGLSSGIQDANENVSQGSRAAQGINEDIEGVKEATVKIKTNSDQVMSSADDMKNMAQTLNEIVATFKTGE